MTYPRLNKDGDKQFPPFFLVIRVPFYHCAKAHILTSNSSSMQDVCHTKAVIEGKLKGAQCYETVKSKVPSI